jgi:hypothetical protein
MGRELRAGRCGGNGGYGLICGGCRVRSIVKSRLACMAGRKLRLVGELACIQQSKELIRPPTTRLGVINDKFTPSVSAS